MDFDLKGSKLKTVPNGELVARSMKLDSLDPQEKVYRLFRGNEASKCFRFYEEGKDFSNIQYSFIFRANQALKIKALIFFGPHPSTIEEEAEYNVCISIAQKRSFFGVEDVIYPDKWCQAQATRGKRFKVEFPLSVPIPSNVWILIRFQLNGPPTDHLLPRDVRVTNLVAQKEKGADKGGSGNIIKFDCLVGSSQLPEIHFLKM